MTKKIKYILLFSILIILGLCTKSQARITTTDPTVESGGTATITINSQESVAYGSIDVTSDGGLTFVSVSGGTANGTKVAFAGTENKKNGIATYKFKVPNVTNTTTYKVTFSSNDMGDAEGNTVASSSATATVTVRGTSNSTGNSSGSNTSNNNTTNNNTPSFTEVNETVYATGSVNVRSSYSTNSSIVGSLDEGDSVTRTGRGSNGWSRVRYNGQTAYINSEYLTTEKPEESNNKNLESLSVGGNYTLSPAFSTNVTDYELAVGSDVNSLEIEAIPEDSNAEVKITGNDNLLIGQNTVEIEVTAEDGTIRTYTIYVTKSENEESIENNISNNGLVLSSLNIEGYALTPEFNSNIYEYNLDIYDENVGNLNIEALPNIEGATIEIVGNNELKLGENIITILVKNGENTTTYQIIVNIYERVVNQIIEGIDNDDLFLYGGIGLAVIIIIIIIIIIISKRKKHDDNFTTYYGEINNLNNEDDKKIDSISSEEINVDKNKNSNLEDIKDEKQKNRKSVIEENFGADINTNEFDYDEDKTKRKRGKHF